MVVGQLLPENNLQLHQFVCHAICLVGRISHVTPAAQAGAASTGWCSDMPCFTLSPSRHTPSGARYHPFGQGSGERIQQDFGLPNLIKFPIVPDLSAAGDGEYGLLVLQLAEADFCKQG
jgi:hypothetical protein